MSARHQFAVKISPKRSHCLKRIVSRYSDKPARSRPLSNRQIGSSKQASAWAGCRGSDYTFVESRRPETLRVTSCAIAALAFVESSLETGTIIIEKFSNGVVESWRR
jgi:hypothetical protein